MPYTVNGYEWLKLEKEARPLPQSQKHFLLPIQRCRRTRIVFVPLQCALHGLEDRRTKGDLWTLFDVLDRRDRFQDALLCFVSVGLFRSSCLFP